MASDNAHLTVEIRTPDGSVFSGGVDRVVTLPGAKAPMGVLRRHAPLMSSLVMGETRLVDSVGTTWTFVTGPGFVEIYDNRVLMLVDTAEDVSEIDIGRAEQALDRARQRLARTTADIDRVRAEAALDRAVTRLRHARS